MALSTPDAELIGVLDTLSIERLWEELNVRKDRLAGIVADDQDKELKLGAGRKQQMKRTALSVAFELCYGRNVMSVDDFQKLNKELQKFDQSPAIIAEKTEVPSST